MAVGAADGGDAWVQADGASHHLALGAELPVITAEVVEGAVGGVIVQTGRIRVSGLAGLDDVGPEATVGGEDLVSRIEGSRRTCRRRRGPTALIAAPVGAA